MQQRLRQALRRPRRRHQPQVAVLDHQPDRGVPPRVGAVDHAELQLGEAVSTPGRGGSGSAARREAADRGCPCSCTAAGRARSTSRTAGSRRRSVGGYMPSPQKLGPTIAYATGWSRTNDSSVRTVFIGCSRLKPPTASANRSGRASTNDSARPSRRADVRHQDRPLDAVGVHVVDELGQLGALEERVVALEVVLLDADHPVGLLRGRRGRRSPDSRWLGSSRLLLSPWKYLDIRV